MKEPFLVDSLIIKNTDTSISVHQDGSLLLTDPNVGSVRLKDIVGKNVIINPAIRFEIDENDWFSINLLQKYFIDIYHEWNLCYPDMVLIIGYDKDNKLIHFEEIQCFPNYVKIISKYKINCKIYIRKI